MLEYSLEKLLSTKINPVDEDIYINAGKAWDSIAKPIDGFGDLEIMVRRIAAIQRTLRPSIDNRYAVIMCADNGIVDEGVSQSGREVTFAVETAMGKGISSACTVAKSTGYEIVPVDIGTDTGIVMEGVRDFKVRRGTRNFAKEPAMTKKECLTAIESGITIVRELKEKGADLIATGEMGIGNTTTSAAILCALLGKKAEDLTGRGAGLDDEGLYRKIGVIEKALLKYDFKDTKSRESGFEVLRTLGGLDIAGLAGIFIGGAIYSVPVLVDGVVCAAAAVCAEKMLPGTSEYMLPSHMGREKGIREAMEFLKLKPVLDANLALGEGTGAMTATYLLKVALDYYNKAVAFDSLSIEEYKRFN